MILWPDSDKPQPDIIITHRYFRADRLLHHAASTLIKILSHKKSHQNLLLTQISKVKDYYFFFILLTVRLDKVFVFFCARISVSMLMIIGQTVEVCRFVRRVFGFIWKDRRPRYLHLLSPHTSCDFSKQVQAFTKRWRKRFSHVPTNNDIYYFP